jgi:uncharacterized protein (DUF2235 family)
MAIIAIFCDGTWNTSDSRAQTHVARLADACAASDGQHVLYFEGVGTGEGMMSRLGRAVNKVGGGLFGWGLNRNIRAAYLALCRLYRLGDRIMIFGFSRGAYTARSLVGLVRKCGILAEPTEANASRAFRLYRKRGAGNAPDAQHVWDARRRLSPLFATSQDDVIRRGDDSSLVRITYLGIWDTVGALGIPGSLLGPVARLWNARYAFHDTSLSRIVENARHAVALDERRVFFEPALWNNLDETDQGIGLNRGDTGETRRYQQVWFAGNHGIVGGSTGPEGLAAASLAWIWAGARAKGLSLKPGQTIPTVLVDVVGKAPALDEQGALYRVLPFLLRWRHGPSLSHELHPTVRLRTALHPEYRPGALRRLVPGLFRRGRTLLPLFAASRPR